MVPGFIDLHVHGGGGAQCNTDDVSEIAAVAAFHARHGTTSFLATTVSAGVGELEAALRAIRSAASASPAGGGGARVLGAHLEGPFLSVDRPGAMDPATFRMPEPAVWRRLLSVGDGRVALMTVAPELPGALEMIAELVEAGVVVSLGHSVASYDDAVAAVRAGARSVTHTFNGMVPLHHRAPGLLGGALDLPELGCELILDGVHVDPVLARLLYRVKGAAGIRLVTDAIAAAGLPDGPSVLGARPVEVRGGRAVLPGTDSLAGSTLTMDAAVAGAVRWLGAGVEEAVAMASAGPAALLGLADRFGAIAPGFTADLVVLDESLRAWGTLVGGRWAVEPPELG